MTTSDLTTSSFIARLGAAISALGRWCVAMLYRRGARRMGGGSVIHQAGTTMAHPISTSCGVISTANSPACLATKVAAKMVGHNAAAMIDHPAALFSPT